MKKQIINGFKDVSKKEMETVDGGFIWEIFGAVIITFLSTVTIIEILRK